MRARNEAVAFRTGAGHVGITVDEYARRVENGEKWCTRCKAWHPRRDFGSDVSRGDGLSTKCRHPARLAARRFDVTIDSVTVVDGTQERVVRRFLERLAVNERGCWEWMGSRNEKGYGCVGLRSEVYAAHRAAYAMFVEPIGDLHVLHRCDNPPCCNPEHLFIGTNMDNVADKVAKGRAVAAPPRFGEEHPGAKISDRDLDEIIARRAAGERCKSIAAAFGIRSDYVSRLTRGKGRTANTERAMGASDDR